MKQLNRKVAVITGAASGIGAALARKLSDQDCKLALCDQDLAGLEAFAAELTLPDDHLLLYQMDVSVEKEWEAFVSKVTEKFDHVHMVFNNAGISVVEKVLDQRMSDIEKVMNINFWGMVYGSHAFMPLLHTVDDAHIINVSSVFGLVGMPLNSAYNASKFAIRGYTEALSMELAHSHINVSSVHPGGVKTNIIKNATSSGFLNPAIRERLITNFNENAPTTAEEAADTILRGVVRNKRRIIVGKDARKMDIISRLFPGTYEKILGLIKPEKK